MKKCPHCAEEIQDEANVCRFCQRDVNPLAPIAVAQAPTPARKSYKAWWLLVPFGFFLSIFGGGPLGPAGVGFILMWVGIAFGMSGTPVVRWGVGWLVTLVLWGMAVTVGGTPVPKSTSRVPATTASAEKLELLASSGRRSDGGDYMKVEGQVKNISDRPIDAVVVVTSWYSDDGTFIASDKGMVDFRPLLAGQTSPFSSLTRRNPVMSKYSVAFTTFGGTVINHRDSSK